jgi:hypothetical protein
MFYAWPCLKRETAYSAPSAFSAAFNCALCTATYSPETAFARASARAVSGARLCNPLLSAFSFKIIRSIFLIMDETRHVEEIANSVYWVGAKDWDRKMFDAFIPLPQGTTYNSYLVKGSEHTALIDTVNPGFWKELYEKVNKVADLYQLEYLVMNHAEPDHASAIPYILGESPGATLVTTAKGAKMAKLYSRVPDDRIMVVKDGDIHRGAMVALA